MLAQVPSTSGVGTGWIALCLESTHADKNSDHTSDGRPSTSDEVQLRSRATARAGISLSPRRKRRTAPKRKAVATTCKSTTLSTTTTASRGRQGLARSYCSEKLGTCFSRMHKSCRTNPKVLRRRCDGNTSCKTKFPWHRRSVLLTQKLRTTFDLH